MLDSETTQAAIMFLISVGTLAATELKERWSIQRQHNADSLDLAKPESIDKAEPIISDILSNSSAINVQRTLDLVHRKQKLIYDAKREKLNTEDEFNEGRITLNMFQLRIERCNMQIIEKFDEIEKDLASLGIEIDRQQT